MPEPNIRYALRVPDDVAALIRGLHPLLKTKVKAALHAIREDPHAGKALKDELAGLRSVGIGRFRVVYRIEDPRIVEIVTVGPRRIIYEETFRIIQRERR